MTTTKAFREDNGLGTENAQEKEIIENAKA